VAEEALVHREAHPGTFDLTTRGLAAQLPGELTHLRHRLGGDRLAEAAEAATGVHRNPAAEGGVAVVEEPLGLALGTQPDVLVPVELES
jgi:hypothetical protein